jgi:DNA-binding response OmpR family regulator
VLDGTPNVAAALVEIGRDPDSLVLVRSDLGDMPVLDFIDVVQAFSDHRVIIGRARDCDTDLVAAAVERGAATSVELPVTPAKLVTAVNLARPHHATAHDVLHVGELALDVEAHRVFWCGVEAQMPPRTFALLYYLMVAHPRVVSMHELAGEFGGGEDSHDRGERVRAAIARVRQVLADAHPAGRQPLETVHRVGYRLSESG